MNSLRLAALLGCLGLGAGCNLCQAPYDYTGPTLAPNGQPVGDFGTRIGSVWADTTPKEPPPQPPPLASDEKEPQGAPTQGAPEQGAPTPGAPEQEPPTPGAPEPGSPEQAPPGRATSSEPTAGDATPATYAEVAEELEPGDD